MPKLNLYIHIPVPLFKARVNLPTPVYPIQEIPYDGVTLGAFADVQFDATLALGTTEGADNLGRVRIIKTATSTKIFIARSGKGVQDGTLVVQDNAYITVWDDYRVWAKIPFFDLDAGIDFKDGNEPPGTFTTELPPVSNCGPGTAGTVDAITGLLTVQFPKDGVNTSFPMADGASITTHDWDVKDGTITVGTSASSIITATFPPGFRWVAYTITDSNGKEHTSRCPVLSIDPAEDPTFYHYRVTQRLEKTGQTLDLEIFQDLDRSLYPDGTLVMFWWGEPSAPDDRSHIKFIGWLDTEGYDIGRDRKGLVKATRLHCIDVNGKLAQLPGFPQALEREVEEELGQWSFMPSLDIAKAEHYIGFWHSTAFNMSDFIMPNNLDDYNTMRLDASGASLFDQLNSLANKIVPDHVLTCNTQGQMVLRPDWRLKDVADRPAITHTITEDYWNEMTVEYSRHPKVHVLRSAAILVNTAFIEVDGEETLPLAFSIAPGDAAAFGQGLSEQQENEGLALSQEDLNESEGHRFAMLNSRYGPFNFIDPSGSLFWLYEPALMQRVQLNVGADYAAQRGLDFTTAAGLVESISIQYMTSRMGTVIKPQVSWLKEEDGHPAMTYIPDDSEDVGYTPPPPAEPEAYLPDYNLIDTNNIIAVVDDGGFIYITHDWLAVVPTWVRTTGADVLGYWTQSVVVDPFSPLYRGLGPNVDFYYADYNGLHKIVDAFSDFPTWIEMIWFTKSFSDDANNDQWRTVAASFGRYQATEADNPWLISANYAGLGTTPDSGTYMAFSVDGGQSWEGSAGNQPSPDDIEEEQLTPHYDPSFAAHGKQPIALWLSPRTPGYAIAFAYNATASPAVGVVYKTEDWGASWSALVTPNIVPGHSMGMALHVPWLNNSDEQIVYHGWASRTANLQYRLKKVNGATITDISPLHGGKNYGIASALYEGLYTPLQQYQAGGIKFGVVTYDGDPNYVALAGMANDASTDKADNVFAVFVSDDAGATWTCIIDPIVAGSPHPQEVAFAANNPNVLYIWGTQGYLKYTDDFGATIQDKEGNIPGFSGFHGNIIALMGGNPLYEAPAPTSIVLLEEIIITDMAVTDDYPITLANPMEQNDVIVIVSAATSHIGSYAQFASSGNPYHNEIAWRAASTTFNRLNIIAWRFPNEDAIGVTDIHLDGTISLGGAVIQKVVVHHLRGVGTFNPGLTESATDSYGGSPTLPKATVTVTDNIEGSYLIWATQTGATNTGVLAVNTVLTPPAVTKDVRVSNTRLEIARWGTTGHIGAGEVGSQVLFSTGAPDASATNVAILALRLNPEV